jgi:hypothetical protein
MARLRSVLTFWYGFVVGDDWRMAAVVVAALAVTFVLSRGGVPSWWALPAAVVLVLCLSIWRAARHRA